MAPQSRKSTRTSKGKAPERLEDSSSHNEATQAKSRNPIAKQAKRQSKYLAQPLTGAPHVTSTLAPNTHTGETTEDDLNLPEASDDKIPQETSDLTPPKIPKAPNKRKAPAEQPEDPPAKRQATAARGKSLNIILKVGKPFDPAASTTANGAATVPKPRTTKSRARKPKSPKASSMPPLPLPPTPRGSAALDEQHEAALTLMTLRFGPEARPAFALMQLRGGELVA